MNQCSNRRPSVAVILPLLNESEIVHSLFSDIRHSLSQFPCDWSVYFVNDGSTDASAEILDGFAQDDQRVKVLHLSRNFGHTAAVRAGLDYVNADAVILMDCDGQDDPNTIPRFLERWKMGADVSVGTVAFASYHRVFTGLAIPGWASVTIVSSFFGAINSLGIAILGEYVARNYEQVRGRPSYIVSRLRNAGTTEADSLDKCSESELLHELAAVSEISTPVTRTQPNSTPVASR